MKVDYLRAIVTVKVGMDITFPEGTLEKIETQISEGDTGLINHYREMIKNQMNMQLHELPKKAVISKCNVKAIQEIKDEPKEE